MPYPLHKVPPGFLGVLNAKVNGQAPQAYAEQIVPTLETLDFYALPNRELLATGIGAAAGSQTNRWTVPSGEVWRLLALEVAVALIAGTSPTQATNLYVGVVGPSNLTLVTAADFRPLASYTVLPLAEDLFIRVPWFAPTPLLLSPGWAVETVANVTLTGVETYSFAARALIERFPT